MEILPNNYLIEYLHKILLIFKKNLNLIKLDICDLNNHLQST